MCKVATGIGLGLLLGLLVTVDVLGVQIVVKGRPVLVTRRGSAVSLASTEPGDKARVLGLHGVAALACSVGWELLLTRNGGEAELHRCSCAAPDSSRCTLETVSCSEVNWGGRASGLGTYRGDSRW